MLKPVALEQGHYECRSLDQTLPILKELLALEAVERGESHAIVKHPNTGWLLVIHEGGGDAPDKPRLNHYGFRVADHKEVETAWKYLEENKERYGLEEVTPPSSAHYAYSIYFKEPGGNHLEIEYYNPRAAEHGRSVAAPHWSAPLTEADFPGRGYIPQALSHGTLQCDDAEASRRFYREVLGLEVVGGGRTSTYIKHPATPWYIVVLPGGGREYLNPVNRFTLKLASPDEVERAQREFAAEGKKLGITELGDLERDNGQVRFLFSDLDQNWWEASTGHPR